MDNQIVCMNPSDAAWRYSLRKTIQGCKDVNMHVTQECIYVTYDDQKVYFIRNVNRCDNPNCHAPTESEDGYCMPCQEEYESAMNNAPWDDWVESIEAEERKEAHIRRK